MESKKQEDKEIQDIIDDITSTAKDLVDEYVSGKDKYVPENDRTEINEKEIKAPYREENKDIKFGVTDEEMEYLFKVQSKIKDTIKKNPDIYIVGEDKKVGVFKYCKEQGEDKFHILEYIGNSKERLRECLRIKIKK
tara:strand:+ start:36 stop:446 length:411 start_codon:yes stop_codon:yes gene_type:complete